LSLKKFESLELIAKGGMAEVYRARAVGPEGFAKDVCVKKILPHLTADEQFVGMFVNEAKLAATLNNANIVQVHDLCVSAESEYFIVMEYVHGKDLSDVIRAAQLGGKEIPASIAVYVARETAKGLYYAHTKADRDGAPLGIIHRDISPQNVLCSFMGEVKLTDFGIAKAGSIMNKTQAGILKGKYGYMSPEQARGEPLDARSDLFCLGIVLYETLVGERCFAGASDYSTLNLMREAVVTPPTQINRAIPKELEAIVLKALAKDKNARWQDALEMEGALAAFAQKSGTEARSTDLTRFMKGLFSSPEARKGQATGVLALSSIVGTPPEKAEKKAANRAATREMEPRASVAPPPERAEKPEKKAKKEKEAPPPEESAEPKERKPARLKGGPPSDDKPSKKVDDKRPVGRRDLRPGLSKLARLEKRGTGRSIFTAVLITLIGAGAGAALGLRESRSVSRDSTLRELERASLTDPGGERTLMVWIDSDPPGATVVLDGAKLAAATPIAVERPADKAEHQLELSLEGFPTLKRTFLFEPGPITLLDETMPGDKGELVVRTRPTNLEVQIDGKVVGRSPLSIDVAHGARKVQISGPGVEPLITEIDVSPGQKTTIDRTLTSAANQSRAKIISDPPGKLLIEGKDTGMRADGRPIPFEPNKKHRVTLIDESRGTERDLWIQLGEGETKTYLITL